MKRYDCITGRRDEKSGKTYWTRIGAAFPRDDGKISVKLDALPVSGEMLLVEPRSRDEGEQPLRRRQRQQEPEPAGDGGDDIPF